MLADYFRVLVFALVGVGFFSFLLFFAGFVRERGGSQDTEAYECGMEPVGTPWVSPNIRFYLFALLFVIFDVKPCSSFPGRCNLKHLV